MCFQLIDFSDWAIYEDAPFGSGASEKVWLCNEKTGQTGLFKFPKIKAEGNITGEYWAEKLAYEIGKLIDIECATVDIGIYNGRRGSMSYNFLKKNWVLNEGLHYITSDFPWYNPDKMTDEVNDLKYSLQMIEKSLFSWEIDCMCEMIVFDCLIGNTDRHHSN